MQFLKRQIPAFSLIEMAIVLVVIGILITAVVKGSDFIQQAKVQSVARKMNEIATAIHTYQEDFHYLPGDDPNASERFQDIDNGNGDGFVDHHETKLVWQHLFKADLMVNPEPLKSRIGNEFIVESIERDNFTGLTISIYGDRDHFALTPKQAMHLKKIIDGANNLKVDQGTLLVEEAKNTHNHCIHGDHINLDEKSACCIVFYKVGI